MPDNTTLPDPLPPNLTPDQASTYLTDRRGVPITKNTLAKKRCVGGGPRFRRFGARRTLYALADLDAWADEIVGPALRHANAAA